MDRGGATPGMNVHRISTIAEFDAERGRWERLEQLDPQATLFTSWRWLRSYLPVARHRWSIMVLREGPDAVAYLPLARGGSLLDRELFLAGNPIADYAGMVALPSHTDAAPIAFADALIADNWDGFNVLDVDDSRIDALVRRLVDRGVRIETADENRCLWCELPATWEQYLAERISSKTRVNTLRVERRLAEALPAFRATEPTDDDIDAHVEAMIAVNHKRWGGNLVNARRRFGALFRNAYNQGLLRMFIYWDGAKPIAGGAAFVDDARSSFGLYMLGFDEEYDKFSPGKGIVGRAIRAAIDGGFARFDFLRGDEPFKARYADQVHVTRHYRLIRPGLRAAAIAYGRPRLRALKLAVADIVYGPGRSL
jgi:CelD/BcsL family acetyltransferase involved in cellulose biosynthesis